MSVYYRVYDHERQKQLEARYELRSAANGTGDRSDKIRTYNFPQVPELNKSLSLFFKLIIFFLGPSHRSPCFDYC